MMIDREAAKRLLYALGDIDEPYLLEAEEQPMKQTKKQIPNPFIPCATLQAAADIAGFSLDAPDAYGTYDHTVIQAIEGEMIEVIYEDASETEGLRIRKGVGTDPISGDDNRYDSEETQTIAGVSVSVRKNGDLIFVAEWTDGGYAHSITSEDGLTADELETLFSQIH